MLRLLACAVKDHLCQTTCARAENFTRSSKGGADRVIGARQPVAAALVKGPSGHWRAGLFLSVFPDVFAARGARLA